MFGGIFNALLAPALFDSVLEYHLTILIACAVRPGRRDSRHRIGTRMGVCADNRRLRYYGMDPDKLFRSASNSCRGVLLGSSRGDLSPDEP